MLDQVVTVGDKLNIRQVYADRRMSEEHLSQLLDISPDGCTSIAMPIEKGELVVMDLNAVYELVFYTEKGLYVCKGKVIRRFKSNHIYVAVLKPISELKKIQRREYYRFDCIIEMKYCEVSEEVVETGEEIHTIQENLGHFSQQQMSRLLELEARMNRLMNQQEKDEFKKGIVTDISGGGIKYNSKQAVETGKIIYLEFVLNSIVPQKISVYGQVVASYVSKMRSDLYENRIKFLNIKDEEREEIIRYIFEEERKLRHKGKRI